MNAFERYAQTLRDARYSSAAIAAAADKLMEAAAELRARQDEIRRLEMMVASADRVSSHFAQKATQRGARLQIVKEWMQRHELMWSCVHHPWDLFLLDRPDAADWFDADGVTR